MGVFLGLSLLLLASTSVNSQFSFFSQETTTISLQSHTVDSMESSKTDDILSNKHKTLGHQHEHPSLEEPIKDDSKENLNRSRREPITKLSKDKLSKLMNLVKAAGMEDCAGRVVCDLNCDASRYGSAGTKVLDMMTKIQNTQNVPVNSIQFLITAGLAGKMYWWTSSCDRCKPGYPKCFAESPELIEVASIFDVDFS